MEKQNLLLGLVLIALFALSCVNTYEINSLKKDVEIHKDAILTLIEDRLLRMEMEEALEQKP